MNDEVLDLIKALPPLPDSIIKLNNIRAQKEYEISEVVNIIKSDPVLSVKVLQYLNSPAFTLRKHISEIHQAIMLLGEEIIVALAFVEATKSLFHFDLSPYLMSEADFYRRANAQLLMMTHWVKSVKTPHKKLLLPAIFLSDFGKLIVSQLIIRAGNTKTMQEKVEMGISLDIAEKESSEQTSAEVTAAMLRHWNFDPNLAELIEHSDNPMAVDASLRQETAMMQSVKNSISLKSEMIENRPFQKLLLNSYGLSQESYIESWKYAKNWLEDDSEN